MTLCYFTALLVKTELNRYLLKVPFLAQEILIENTCDENVEEIIMGEQQENKVQFNNFSI